MPLNSTGPWRSGHEWLAKYRKYEGSHKAEDEFSVVISVREAVNCNIEALDIILGFLQEVKYKQHL